MPHAHDLFICLFHFVFWLLFTCLFSFNIHVKITSDPCYLIGSHWCNLLTNCTVLFASNPIFFSFISIILMNIMCDSGVILKEKLILLLDFEIKHMIPDQIAPQSVQLPLSFTEEM